MAYQSFIPLPLEYWTGNSQQVLRSFLTQHFPMAQDETLVACLQREFDYHPHPLPEWQERLVIPEASFTAWRHDYLHLNLVGVYPKTMDRDINDFILKTLLLLDHIIDVDTYRVLWKPPVFEPIHPIEMSIGSLENPSCLLGRWDRMDERFENDSDGPKEFMWMLYEEQQIEIQLRARPRDPLLHKIVQLYYRAKEREANANLLEQVLAVVGQSTIGGLKASAIWGSALGTEQVFTVANGDPVVVTYYRYFYRRIAPAIRFQTVDDSNFFRTRIEQHCPVSTMEDYRKVQALLSRHNQ